jgi:hypothetical protein
MEGEQSAGGRRARRPRIATGTISRLPSRNTVAAAVTAEDRNPCGYHGWTTSLNKWRPP